MVQSFTKTKIIMLTIFSIITLQGCASSTNERNQEEAERWANIWEQKPVEVDNNNTSPQRPVVSQPSSDQQISEADSLLSNQEDRIKRIETNISALSQNQQLLRQELAEVKEKTSKLEKVIIDYHAAANNTDHVVSPSSAKGIHLASYKTLDNLKFGWKEFSNSGHQAILNKEARIVHTNVSGIEYLRLVVGPYEDTDEARAACEIMKQTIAFCNIMDFNGEPLE
jgi:hypothetical protein